jgi:arabinose-5-phosphate isomerase
MLERGGDIQVLMAADIMGHSPLTIDAEALAVEGFYMMEQNNITQLVVTDKGLYCGVVHLHDILKEGIF